MVVEVIPVDFNGMTDEEVAERNRVLLPKRRERVARRCADGHDWDGRTYPRCRRCTYFQNELKAWGLLGADAR